MKQHGEYRDGYLKVFFGWSFFSGRALFSTYIKNHNEYHSLQAFRIIFVQLATVHWLYGLFDLTLVLSNKH